MIFSKLKKLCSRKSNINPPLGAGKIHIDTVSCPEFFDGEERVRCTRGYLNINIYKGDLIYVAESEEMGITAPGASREEALRMFHQIFILFYKRYIDNTPVWESEKGIKGRLDHYFYKVYP